MAERNKKASKDEAWWVEVNKKRERVKPPEHEAPIGKSFFSSVQDYDQVQAEKNLTDLNLKLLSDANAEPGVWGYLALLEKKSSQREIDKIKRAVPLPRNARGVMRAIVTDTSDHGVLMEFNFIAEASFDCWIRNEWVCEKVFKGKHELLRRADRLLKKYLRRGARAGEEFFDAPSPAGTLPPARTEW